MIKDENHKYTINEEQYTLDQQLHFSVEENDIQKIKESLENGADVNAEDNYALRVATINGYYEAVKLLVNHGADLNTLKKKNMFILPTNEYKEVIYFLIKQGCDIATQYVKMIAETGDIKMLSFLFENGADINKINKDKINRSGFISQEIKDWLNKIENSQRLNKKLEKNLSTKQEGIKTKL